GIGLGHHVGGGVVHASQISSVTAVASAKVLWRGLEHQDACAIFPRSQGCRQSCIASADYQHVRHFHGGLCESTAFGPRPESADDERHHQPSGNNVNEDALVAVTGKQESNQKRSKTIRQP